MTLVFVITDKFNLVAIDFNYSWILFLESRENFMLNYSISCVKYGDHITYGEWWTVLECCVLYANEDNLLIEEGRLLVKEDCMSVHAVRLLNYKSDVVSGKTCKTKSFPKSTFPINFLEEVEQ